MRKDLKTIDVAYRVFARMHPHEAYDEDPETFWLWFHDEHPDEHPEVSRDEMVKALEETR